MPHTYHGYEMYRIAAGDGKRNEQTTEEGAIRSAYTLSAHVQALPDTTAKWYQEPIQAPPNPCTRNSNLIQFATLSDLVSIVLCLPYI